MTEPEQHFFESQRLRLSYWTWGDPSNQPVLLQHGGRDHARSWDPIAEALCGDYYVVAPDLRGHGDSQWELGGEYSIRQHVVDFLALTELVQQPLNVIAHSYGGLITSLAAGSYPERFRAIVSIEGRVSRPGPDPEPLTPERMRRAVERRRDLEQRTPRAYASVEEAATRMQETNPRLSDAVAERLARHGTRAVEGAEGGYRWKFDNWSRPGVRRDDISRAEGEAFAAAVECPVLLIVGELSGARENMQELARHFPRGRAIVVPGAGHWVHHDQSETVIREARAWFARAGA